MAFRSSSSLTGGNVNGAAVPVPSGAASGDIAIVGIYVEDTITITPPSGFTLKSNLATSAVTHGRLAVYWKRLTGADTGTYAFTWTSAGPAWRGAACALFSGRLASGDPFDGTVGAVEGGSTSTTVNVSTSPAGANGDAVGFWTNFNGGGSFTAPTNYTERQDVSGVITLDTRDAVASGSTGNVTATCTITDWMKAFLGVLAEASSGITGTAAVTETGDTSSASGQLGYSGASAATEAADTSSASGQLGYSGTVARTQANQTSSASGQLGYSGTAAVTQAAQTASASGIFTAGGSFAGSVAVTQASQTASASGQLGYSGSVAVGQANQTSAASGKLGYSGTSAVTQAANTSSASGLVIIPITGTVAVTQANQFATASGVNQPLVSFGTSSAGTGTAPSAHPNAGLAPYSVPASLPTPTASGASTGVPTSTGG